MLKTNQKILIGIVVLAIIAGAAGIYYFSRIGIMPRDVRFLTGTEKIIFYENGKQKSIDAESQEGAKIIDLLSLKLQKLNLQAKCVFSEENVKGIKQKDKVVELIFKEPLNITISQRIELGDRDYIAANEKGYRVLENLKSAIFVLEDNLDEWTGGHILVASERKNRDERCSWKVTEEDSEKYEALSLKWSMIAGYEFDEEQGCIPVGGSNYVEGVVPFKTKDDCEMACGRMWSCWAIKQKYSNELDKSWIEELNELISLIGL